MEYVLLHYNDSCKQRNTNTDYVVTDLEFEKNWKVRREYREEKVVEVDSRKEQYFKSIIRNIKRVI